MRIRIKYQILLIAMIPVILIDVFFTYVNINSSVNQAEKLLQSKGEIIAQQIAGASEFSLLSGDYEQIQHVINQSIDSHEIIFLAVYDAEGGIIVQQQSTFYDPALSSEYSYYRQSIQTQNIDHKDIFEPDQVSDDIPQRSLGWVHMYISKQQLQQNKINIFYEGAVFFCTMLLISIFLTLIISRRITGPIYSLLNHLKQVETGQLGELINDLERNEIGDVQKGFNSMSQSLLANRMQLDEKIKTATVELMNAIANLEYNNRELGIARDIAQKADRVKTQFLTNMSHEIRTPINGIKGFLNLLSNSGLNKYQVRYADIITRSTSDLSNIVNEILDFSKIESGKIEILESEFDLIELIENTRDSLFASTIEKRIDLYLTIYSDTPRMIIGDTLRLKQILINLVNNAIKFTAHGFVSITVLVEDESDDQVMIKFNIQDSGIGISRENQLTLFKAFHQIESDTNRRYTGTGLGLVISKNLANLMGGDITLKSEVGSGSLFSVIIPFKYSSQQNLSPKLLESNSVMIYGSDRYALKEIQSLFNRIEFTTETQLIDKTTSLDILQNQLIQNLKYIDFVVIDLRHNLVHPDELITQKVHDHCEVIIMHYDLSLIDINSYPAYRFISVINSSNNLLRLLTEPSNHDDVAIPVTQQKTNINAKNILIVDDNLINLELATELTRLWGHNPQQASNAKKAMLLFNSIKFDLILLDIQMPEVDGVELMQMMRKQQPELETPIIAITANVIESERERLLNLGFNAYISKPVDDQKLKNLLSQESYHQEVNKPPLPFKNLDESIDLDLTLKLSANNENLVMATFSMLQLEIPDYLGDLHMAIELSDTRKIDAIMHKLQGITCYVGLPQLKKLLTDYQNGKNNDNSTLLDISTQINNELIYIDQAIEQYKKTHTEG